MSTAQRFWPPSRHDGRNHQARERVALLVIGTSFLLLAAFASFVAVRAMLGGHEAEHSSVGIAIAALSLAIMPLLSWAQGRAGRELGSPSAVADSHQTLLCTYLSAVLLAGLLLNSLWGISWADPVAAMVIAAVAVPEGVGALRGDACCAPTAPRDLGADGSVEAEACGCCASC
ncbi:MULTISPECIES: cation transporter [unclassified Nocardioides]|uniref:cation transporter n=1 Tax=unclassified Nocardioides TaxID=2615069 RepID=UPI00240555C3|nr:MULTISPECIES: cation transporter [unclassified Nocardioides]